MKRILFIALMLTTGFVFLKAQEKPIKPEEKSIVNKEFDENGNLIRYDSTFVWSWSGDSAFQFEFPMNGFFSGNDIPGFDESMMDSVFSGHLNHNLFSFKSFESDEFFKQFQQQFSDSAISQQFDFFGDSVFVFPFDFGNSFSDEFFSKDFDAMHEKLLQQLNGLNSEKPDFESKEQEKAWLELMEKQRKEQQELLEHLKKQNNLKGTDKKENPMKVY